MEQNGNGISNLDQVREGTDFTGSEPVHSSHSISDRKQVGETPPPAARPDAGTVSLIDLECTPYNLEGKRLR